MRGGKIFLSHGSQVTIFNIKSLICAVTIVSAVTISSFAQSSGTAFTYQGELKRANVPAQGYYCFEFRLFDSLVDGTMIGPVLTPCNVSVDDGRFSLNLDFGSGVFDAGPRWLEIRVVSDGGAVVTTLSPRQEIMPAPRAMYSESAGMATTASMAAQAETAANGVPSGYFIMGTSKYPPPGFQWSGSTVASKKTTGDWRWDSPLPALMHKPVGGVINGTIYTAEQNKTYMYRAETATWESRAPMPTPRTEASGAAANGKLYVLGGANSSVRTALMEAFDPATNLWETCTPAPIAVSHAAAAAMNGKIYFFGGMTIDMETDQTNIYDTETDTWSSGAPVPAKKSRMVAVANGGKIHLIGGMSDVISPETEQFIYDVGSDTWTNGPTLPEKIVWGTGVSFQGKVHVLGGLSGNLTDILATHQVYDPESERWTILPPMPTGREFGLALPFGTDGILVTGEDDEVIYSTTTVIYELESLPPYYVHIKQ